MISTAEPAALEPLEIVAGFPLEELGSRASLGEPPHVSGREALEQEVLDAAIVASDAGQLSVSFSGGRDSSLILAVATHVCRREGLPDPIPVSMRHTSPESDERSWQELVLTHLGLRDRHVVAQVGDTADVLGEHATRVLRTSGLLSPANAYLHVPMVEAAPRGVLLTGAGGDEVLSTYPNRLSSLLSRRSRPRPRDVRAVGLAFSPRWVRRRHAARQLPLDWMTWPTTRARAAIVRRLADADVVARVRWDVASSHYVRSRSVRWTRASLAMVGSPYGVDIRSPLLSERFVHAFAADVGRWGPTSRTASMQRLASDLLPPELLARHTKAVFGGVVWGPEFRSFVRRWDPTSLDTDVARLLSVERLAAAWRDDNPAFATMSLVQKAWLDQHADA